MVISRNVLQCLSKCFSVCCLAKEHISYPFPVRVSFLIWFSPFCTLHSFSLSLIHSDIRSSSLAHSLGRSVLSPIHSIRYHPHVSIMCRVNFGNFQPNLVKIHKESIFERKQNNKLDHSFNWCKSPQVNSSFLEIVYFTLPIYLIKG